MTTDITIPALTHELSADADEPFDPDGGPWVSSGISVAPGDILRMDDGTPVLMTEAELRKAAPTQADEPLSVDHPTDENGEYAYPPPSGNSPGTVTAAGFIDEDGKSGVGYQTSVHDPDIARGLHAENYEVSVHPQFELGEQDPETGAYIAENIQFRDLSIVTKGDSPSNTANWGASAELAAWAHQTDIGAELTAAGSAGEGGRESLVSSVVDGTLRALGLPPGEVNVDSAELAAEQDPGPVQYDGTATGSLDKSAIPNDSYKSHYIFAADTKSKSGFPVVDASGDLRRGNVDSAWKFKKDAPVGEQRFAEYLRNLAKEFDDPPVTTEDVQELEAAAQPSDEAAESASDADTTQDQTTMVDVDREMLVEAISKQTDLDTEVLQELNDESIATIYGSVVKGDDGSDDDADEQPDDDGQEEDSPEQTTDAGSVEASADGLTADDVREIVASEQEQGDREGLIATITDRTDKDDDDLAEWPLDALEDKAASVTSAAQLPGSTGRHTDSVTAAYSGDDDDLDAYGTGVAEH